MGPCSMSCAYCSRPHVAPPSWTLSLLLSPPYSQSFMVQHSGTPNQLQPLEEDFQNLLSETARLEYVKLEQDISDVER